MGCRTTSSGNKVTYCGSCGDVLLGDAIKVATNLHYHIHCFVCTECGCELVNTGFFTKLAKYYCAEDYHASFGTLCTLCHKYIEGEGLSVQGKGKSYHISCLTCTKCGGRFDEGSRITFEKDQALCDSCKVTGVKGSGVQHVCAACNEVIVGTSIFAMEQEWHVDCFTCQECKKPLTGEYMCKDGTPYCEEDYQTLYGQSCNICSEFILGKVLQAGGNSYHTSCLKCYICTQQFEEGQEIFMQDELFWHTDCDETTDNVIEVEEQVPKQDEVVREKEETAEEKSPPELVLPPPPSATPPPDTPVTTPTENKLTPSPVPKEQASLSVEELRDRSQSILSDYEELTVLQEAGKEVIYDSDFDDDTQPEKPVQPVQPQPIKTREPLKSAEEHEELKELKKPSVSEDQVKPAVEEEEEKEESTPAPEPKEESESESGGSVSSVPLVEPQSTTVDSDASAEKSETVFTDVSETVVIKQNGRDSLTSENLELGEEEEEHLSVKEILRRTQQKEREAMGNAVLQRKTEKKPDRNMSKRFLSTDSENSDRGSETSDPPAKPPRAKSPVRKTKKPEMIVQPVKKLSLSGGESEENIETSPSSTLRGLKTVDSPILKLLDEIDNKEEHIDYLNFQETYELTVLQTQKFRLPHGIDRSQLQQYLDPEQFQVLFKMPIEQFDSLPLWKKTNLKKSLKLF